MVAELLPLALDYYRSPLRYRHLADPKQPLPKSFDGLMIDFAAALTPQNTGATAQKLGAAPTEIREAALFFLRQVLLAPGADHYRVLGLSRNASEEAVRQHYRLLVRIFHPDRSTDDSDRDAAYTARLNAAYNELRNPASRRRYDRQLQARSNGRGSEPRTYDFFQPNHPITPFLKEDGPPRRFRMPARRTLAWTLAGLAAATLLFLLVRPSTQPTLRSSPELVKRSAAGPSFLKGGKPNSSGESTAHLAQSAPPADVARASRARPAPPPVPDQAADTDAGGTATANSEPGPDESPNRDKTPEAAQVTPANAPSLAAVPTDTITSGRSPIVESLQGPPAKVSAGTIESDHPQTDSQAGAEKATPEPPAAHRDHEAPDPPRKDLARHRGPSATEGKGTERAALQSTPEADPRLTRDSSTRPRQMPVKEAPAKGTDERKAIAKRQASPVERTDVSATSAPPAPPQKAAAPSTRARPSDIISRLTRSYQNGDLDGFVGLFAANAQVNDGSGTAFIRSDYADLFSRVPQRRLSVQNLKWRPGGDAKLVGSGTIMVSSNGEGASGWRHSAGTIHFELIPWMGRYKISKMIHRLTPR
ncbi:MAG: DnaJ domain-containing protein [Pseudomonadota bacterium]|nr:DnaJ domain-containing protein [Pseudomonadota bacterium]